MTTSTSIGSPVAGWASSRVAARPSIRGMRTSMSDEVGRAAAGQRDGLDAVGGLADDLDVGLGLEDRPQPAAHDRLVVGEQHADRRHGASVARRQHGVDAPAEAVGARAGVEPAADERGALAHPGDAAAVAGRPVAARAVVPDVDERLAVGEVDRHGGPRRPRVAGDVGQRLLDDPERRRLHVGRQRVVRGAAQDAHVDARGADRVQQRVEVGEPRRRSGRRRRRRPRACRGPPRGSAPAPRAPSARCARTPPAPPRGRRRPACVPRPPGRRSR